MFSFDSAYYMTSMLSTICFMTSDIQGTTFYKLIMLRFAFGYLAYIHIHNIAITFLGRSVARSSLLFTQSGAANTYLIPILKEVL
jgi:hypothetical protein